jgi:hypothetical protein
VALVFVAGYLRAFKKIRKVSSYSLLRSDILSSELSSKRTDLIFREQLLLRNDCKAILLLAMLAVSARTLLGQTETAKVSVRWGTVVRTSEKTPTLQVVVNPLLRRGSRIHEQAFRWLKEMQADYVRYVPWLPYPRLGVAELRAPGELQP